MTIFILIILITIIIGVFSFLVSCAYDLFKIWKKYRNQKYYNFQIEKINEVKWLIKLGLLDMLLIKHSSDVVLEDGFVRYQNTQKSGKLIRTVFKI